jgi:hypothetical protein
MARVACRVAGECSVSLKWNVCYLGCDSHFVLHHNVYSCEMINRQADADVSSRWLGPQLQNLVLYY